MARRLRYLLVLPRRAPVSISSLKEAVEPGGLVQAANIAYVAQQLDHANPAITLTICTHLIRPAEQADKTSAILEATYGLS